MNRYSSTCFIYRTFPSPEFTKYSRLFQITSISWKALKDILQDITKWIRSQNWLKLTWPLWLRST